MSEIKMIDMPIEDHEQESLGISMYADILSDFIRNCATPTTIGIQGDWGIGKTSLMNMVKKNLVSSKRRPEKYHVIYFNTWQYSQFNQEEFLGLSILKGIMNDVKKLDNFGQQNNEKLKVVANDFGRFVANLGNQIIKGHLKFDVKEAIDNISSDEKVPSEDDVIVYLSRMKDKFSGLVNSLIGETNSDDKLVILIDDLDRIKPIRALEFLEAIKNFLDVEHCVFVMAVDYSVIQTGMIEKLGRSAQELQGKSYFDKIIQVPFNMPVGSYKTDQYIMSLLGWDFNGDGKYKKQDREDSFLRIKDYELPNEQAEFFDNITSLTVGKNPRSIKRAVNYANLLKMVVRQKRTEDDSKKGEKWKLEDAKILYSLACMQLAWPELFQHFAEKPSPDTIHLYQDFDYISKITGIGALFKRVWNQDEVKSQITGFFDEFISLIDKNGDGEINTQEFKPIWDIMVEANLTSQRLTNFEDELKQFKNRAIEQAEGNGKAQIDKIMRLITDSKWKDPSNFKLLAAGRKFWNIIWDKKQIGSLVTTKKELIQMYLKIDVNKLKTNLPEEIVKFVQDVKNLGHYGTGDTKICLNEISDTSNGIEIMNSILEKYLEQIPETC